VGGRTPYEIVVFIDPDAGAPASVLVARTRRALGGDAAGIDVVAAEALETRLRRAPGPIWLLRAGSVPPAGRPFRVPSSATGRPLVAFGALRGDPTWDRALSTTGGELARFAEPLPVESVYLERPRALPPFEPGRAPTAALDALRRSPDRRVVRLDALDVLPAGPPRIAQVVTALHDGGAERIALSLHARLPEHGFECRLYVLDAPRRAALPAPPDTVLLADAGRSRVERVDALARRLAGDGVDLVQAHLLDGDELRILAASGVPVTSTLHNDRAGWPAGLGDLEPGVVRSWFACAEGVGHAARAAGLSGPVRVVPNGIEPPAPAPETDLVIGRARARARARWRAAWGIDPDAIVVLVVANPRPQKRPDRAVATLAALRDAGHDAHLVWIGAPLPVFEDVTVAARALAVELGVADAFHEVGAVQDAGSLAEMRAAADVALLSSDWEGSSLAALEAVAAGLPLVTTAVSGADELAAAHAGVFVVPFEHEPLAPALAAAVVAASAAGGTRRSPTGLAPRFTAAGMAARQARVLRWCLAPVPVDGPVVLVTNNFSTGGAQTSAARLLTAWRARGVDARAWVIQEQGAWPTPGTERLRTAGVPVAVASPEAGCAPAAATVDAVLAGLRETGARAVLFWNVIPEHKVRLAEALSGEIPVFDVSPGEMFFASLHRLFARPPADLPVSSPRAYGGLLTGVAVKFAAEAERARAVLGVEPAVIPNGLLVAALPPARLRPAPTPDAPVIFGTLARLAPDKRLDVLITAAARAATCAAPGLRFEVRMAGGPEPDAPDHADTLRALAERLGAPVRFVGVVEAAVFLETLDAFVLVAEPEGCPNASLEAMAAGLPVVATAVGGVIDQLADGAGLLVPRGDVDGLADALVRLAADAALRAELGHRAHARTRVRYTLDAMVAAYTRLLNL
jgi:glycosyltransferase involved in cell wall biosynthesis